MKKAVDQHICKHTPKLDEYPFNSFWNFMKLSFFMRWLTKHNKVYICKKCGKVICPPKSYEKAEIAFAGFYLPMIYLIYLPIRYLVIKMEIRLAYILPIVFALPLICILFFKFINYRTLLNGPWEELYTDKNDKLIHERYVLYKDDLEIRALKAAVIGVVFVFVTGLIP